MRLTETQMKTWTDDITFKKGMDYYEDGLVENLIIEIKRVSGKNDLTAFDIKTMVKSFDRSNNYDIKMDWNIDSNQIRANCSCPKNNDENKNTTGPCRHIIAVLLKYINEYQENILNPQKPSELDNLLNELMAASEGQNSLKRELAMDIKYIISTHEEKPYIEFKIGLEKSYVIKSMKKFLDAVINMEDMEFGKNFTYSPDLHKFKESDEKLIDMLTDIKDIDREQNHYFDYYNSGSNSIFSGKKVFLTNKLIYKFFSVVKGRTVNMEVNGVAHTDISIIEGQLPLKFNLGLKGSDIELSQLSKLPAPLDESFRVFFFEGAVYLPPKEQAALYAPIYKLFTRKRNAKMSFNKKEGETFASYVLPMIKKVAEDVAFDPKLKDSFYEAPLVIKAYLDKEDRRVTASLNFSYGDVEINPLTDNKSDKISKPEKAILVRDITKEEQSSQILKSFGFKTENQKYVMDNEKDIVSFITEGMEKLQGLGEVYYSQNFKEIKVYGKSSLKGGIRLNEEDLLEFTFQLEGVAKGELKNIFNALREKKKYFRLKKGGFIDLNDQGIQDLGEMLDYLDIKDNDLNEGKMLISKYNALYLDQKIKDKDMEYLKRSRNFRELANNIRDVKDMDYSLPEHLEEIMRNYQKTGFRWFKTLSAYGFGGILADEMGLGKTLQTIAFLLSEKGGLPSLVIAPTSLVYNWQIEIERFGTELKTIVVSGSKKQREELMSDMNDCDVIITSYPLIRRDIEVYKTLNFNYCILDEAQQIKNPTSINAASVKELKAKGYFALTGTPIENSLMELWSIFDYILPGYLFTQSKFSKLYEAPIIKNNDKTALEELNRHVKPFILRRHKKDVIKELPPKIEQKLVVEMTEEQKKLYAAYLSSAKNEIFEEIKDKGFNKSKIKILSILTRLRQICCDPSVFIDGYEGDSGKMLALQELLEESIGEDHKVLLFSQFTSVLKNISKRLDKNGTKYMYLDGNTKSEHRMGLVNEFNEGDARIFLISLKAGGTGLNLTGADIVIHFDPWWNPAVEDQATDRAHRIGQHKTVEVIKLLAQGTIEEKIFNLQQKKKEMIKSIMNEELNEENMISQMTQEDLESLFL